jgi:hypothetical protein
MNKVIIPIMSPSVVTIGITISSGSQPVLWPRKTVIRVNGTITEVSSPPVDNTMDNITNNENVKILNRVAIVKDPIPKMEKIVRLAIIMANTLFLNALLDKSYCKIPKWTAVDNLEPNIPPMFPPTPIMAGIRIRIEGYCSISSSNEFNIIPDNVPTKTRTINKGSVDQSICKNFHCTIG